ncbi:MAG: hypothetical protein FJ098_17240, partial [Deltaproteobacteria bacterium]|nr:hypothetical protein [Deltaproteobacteria bacterium]
LEGFAGDTLEGWRPALKVGLGGARLFGRRPDLVLALRALADTQFGDAPAWEHLQAGGILGVRGLTIAGFEPDHRLQGSAELRWMPFRSARLSLARTAFLRAMQLVLFSDAAALGERWDAWLDARHLYVSAGLGVRIHADLFGVFPAVLSVDEAVILPVLGKQLAFATLVYFSQSF